MPAITLAIAQTTLGQYLAAQAAVLAGQAYQIGNRSLKRADLKSIQEGIREWSVWVDRLSGGRGGIRLRGVTPNG